MKKRTNKTNNSNKQVRVVPAKRTARKIKEQKPVIRQRVVRKVKYKAVLVFLIIVLLFYIVINDILKIPITNIVIKNNTFYTDQEIIEKAKINNYPSTLKTFSFEIKNNLVKDKYIISAKVYKKWLTRVYIEVNENIPLFFYIPEGKTVLKDNSRTDDLFTVPVVVNYIPDTIYDKFIKKYKKIDSDILDKISEIKYDPVSDIDEERFYLTMNDGNYVYITLNNFTIINKYVSILKRIGNKKGTLYLDDGEYFEPRVN